MLKFVDEQSLFSYLFQKNEDIYAYMETQSYENLDFSKWFCV